MTRSQLKTAVIVISSGIGGVVLFLAATAGYIYFQGGAKPPEASMTFHDQIYEENFIKVLKEQEIPYRRESDGSIWYSVIYLERINEIIKQVSTSYPGMFEIYNIGITNKFEELLRDSGISYEIYDTKKGKSIIVKSEQKAKASELFEIATGRK